MNIEKVHRGIRYTLSNDNNKIGDLVYPIARGRCLEGGSFILHDLDFRDFMCGFPDEPHTIKNIEKTKNKSLTTTDMGYSHPECYFKIIKMESHEKVVVKDAIFARWEWIELPI